VVPPGACLSALSPEGPVYTARGPRAYDRPGDPSPRTRGRAVYYHIVLSCVPLCRILGSSAPGPLPRGTTARDALTPNIENTSGSPYPPESPRPEPTPMVRPSVPAVSTTLKATLAGQRAQVVIAPFTRVPIDLDLSRFSCTCNGICDLDDRRSNRQACQP